MPLLDQLRDNVANAIRSGRTLDEIDEEIIRPSTVPEDAQAALWLWAFCLLSRGEQRELVAESLRSVSVG